MTTTNVSHAGLACALATCLCLSACGGGGGGGGGGGAAFYSGALDPTLGGDGYAFVDLPGTETVTGVAVQPDGKIVVAGTASRPATGADMFVVRFNAGGTLDTSFNGSGIQYVDFMGGADEALAVALRASDGAIFLVGRTDFLGGSVAIAELTPTGDLEAGFGVGGQVVLALTTAPDEATAVAVQPDDNVLVAGTVGISSTSNMFVTRLTPSGDFDATWHGNLTGFSEVRTLTWLNKEECHAMALDPITGNVVVAGFTDYTGGLGLDFAVARLLPTGFPDTTFNGTGQTTVDFGGDDDTATGVQIDLVGRVLVSGNLHRSFDGITNPVVARLGALGALDATFHDVPAPAADDGDGRFSYRTHAGPPGTDQIAAASLLQHDGRLVIAGATALGGYTPRNFLASRLTVDGNLDTSFANGAGIEGVSFDVDEDATAIAQDVPGNLFLAGVTRDAGFTRVLVMRLMP